MKHAVMADGQDGAVKSQQGLFQNFARVDVQMVGRFVQKQDIRLLRQQQAGQVQPRALAAAQDLQLLVDMRSPRKPYRASRYRACASDSALRVSSSSKTERVSSEKLTCCPKVPTDIWPPA
jgi:hypothetical protein